MVTAKGRPIEFHCTAPVLPNRAQEILYGKTLPSFLLCDQIGCSLIEPLQSHPQILVTDCVEMIGLVERSSMPMAWLPLSSGNDSGPHDAPGNPQTAVHSLPGATVGLTDSTSIPPPSYLPFQRTIEKANQTITVLGEHSDAVDIAVDVLNAFTDLLPLSEPFERIHNAIAEAHKVAA